jgi:hypothetical protein
VPIDGDILEVEAKEILHKDMLENKNWKGKSKIVIR